MIRPAWGGRWKYGQITGLNDRLGGEAHPLHPCFSALVLCSRP
nr:MAG TPA: hypothetical protein [Caudoviricetes sp.]